MLSNPPIRWRTWMGGRSVWQQRLWSLPQETDRSIWTYLETESTAWPGQKNTHIKITQIPQNIKCSQSFPPPSEDLFFLPHPPGRTLVVGGTAEGLECAGFLFGLGLPVTIMPQPGLLPGFDKKMAQRIENHLIVSGVEILYHCSLSEVLSEKKTASATLL